MVRIEHFELSTSHPTALTLEAGCVIRVSSGRLWLTVQGHADDVWLQAAGSFTLPARGTLWISAEPTAQFTVAQRVKAWRWPTLPGFKSALSGPRQVPSQALCSG